MLVNREVTVKVIVTEEFKERLLGRLGDALQQIELTQKRLDAQGKQYLAELSARDPAQAETFRRRLERQARRQETTRVGLVKELEAAERLEPGAEYRQGTVDSLVDIHVGDRLDERLHGAEILVKDGIVLEIRQD